MEPVTHPPEPMETRPPPPYDESIENNYHKTDEAILGSKSIFVLTLLITSYTNDDIQFRDF